MANAMMPSKVTGGAPFVAKALAAVVVSSSLALATAAYAQQTQKAAPAAPAGKAAPAAPAQKGAAAPQGDSPWVKLCEKAKVRVKLPDGKDGEQEKTLCLTTHEQLDATTGLPVVSAAIRQAEGVDKNVLAIMVPLGMVIPLGMKAAVAPADIWARVIKGEQIDDKQLKVASLQYAYCYAAGCTAEVEATKEMVDDMNKGAGLLVRAVDILGRPAMWGVPLAGFSQAFVGAPTDNKKYAEARAAFMKQIEQQYADQRKAALEKDPKLAEAFKKLQEAQKEMATAAQAAQPAAAPAAAAPPAKKK
jgi:invasion protein IalB